MDSGFLRRTQEVYSYRRVSSTRRDQGLRASLVPRFELGSVKSGEAFSLAELC